MMNAPSTHITLPDAIEQLRQEMRVAGINPPTDIRPTNGKPITFSTNGKAWDKTGWLFFHADGSIPWGSFGDHRGDVKRNWRADIGRSLTTAEEAAYRESVRVFTEAQAAETARRNRAAAEKSRAMLEAGTDPDGHAYLIRKQVRMPPGAAVCLPLDTVKQILNYAPQANGDALEGDVLVVPFHVEGELTGAELIDGAGRKSAISGSIKSRACWLPAPIPADAPTIAIGEGTATVLTVFQATGWPVVAALCAGNLEAIARQMRHSHPHAEIVIMADLVKKTREPDPHAARAAAAVNGRLAVPDLQPVEGTDFNDLAVSQGLDAVRTALSADPGKHWPKPQPLAFSVPAEPFPLDALPPIIRAAVVEVTDFTQAPIALAVGSALGAVATAGQALIDVARASRLTGPVSLNLLTIADSGERKSTVDGFFTQAILNHQSRQADLMAPAMADYDAAMAAWEAKRTGASDAIRTATKRGKPSDIFENDLRQLERDKPKAPRVPRLVYEDTSPEKLALRLAVGWPSGGIMSGEAGTVLGGHGMGKESIVRYLSLLNKMWDGGTLTVDRKTTDSFTLRGARLSVSLLIQEPTLRAFFDKSDGLARGTGFFARFLLAWPESTQGTRRYRDAPESWPGMDAFNDRLTAILEITPTFDPTTGTLRPTLMQFTPAAKDAWIAYHDAIEGGLMAGGELHDVRDIASKSADNAARLAALFALFEGGESDIGLAHFEGASRVAAWYLNESLRFFGELAQASELTDAVKLDEWLTAYLRREGTGTINKNQVRQRGPIRDGGRLDAAITELEGLDRLRIYKRERTTLLELNPALLETWS
jgi:putative DNA primase/helicase